MSYFELAYMFCGFLLGGNFVITATAIRDVDDFKAWVGIIGMVSGLLLFTLIPVWR